MAALVMSGFRIKEWNNQVVERGTFNARTGLKRHIHHISVEKCVSNKVSFDN